MGQDMEQIIFQMCVCTHMHTHMNMSTDFTEQVNPIIFRGQTTEESSVKYLTYTTTVS